MATSGPGGFVSNGEIVIINNIKVNLDKIKDEELIVIGNHIIHMLENHIKIMQPSLDSETKFESFFKICQELIKRINNIEKEVFNDLNNKSKQFKMLLKNIFRDLYYIIEHQIPLPQIENYKENIDYYINTLSPVLGKIKNLDKIKFFAENTKKEIIIIGGNGAGKSSFIGFLKEIYSSEMIVIPSQKLLVYDNNIGGIMQKKDIDLVNILQENFIKDLQSMYISASINSLSSSFSTIISAIANKTIMEQNAYFEQRNKNRKHNCLIEPEKFVSTLDKVNKLWSKVIKNTIFYLNTETHCLEPETAEGNRYSINSLSDGEKIILFYIGSILMANKCSYIVIDEPETYLNPSIYKILWDILEEERNDCQFIYITHEMDFMRTRRNSDVLWMKKYELPNDWNIVPIKEMEIPRELWLEIYGSQNKIIFCEGDKESLDYSVYTILFGDRYSIIPVGSCLNVCKYTEVYNEASDFLNNNAIGIIDFDNRNDDEIEKLRNKKIFVTKFNEIEMLLLDEEIIRKVLDKFTKEKIDEKVNKFEEEFFKLIEEQKEKIVFDFIKKIVDQKINNYKIKSKKVEQINTELITFIKELKCEKEYKIFHRLIEKNLQEKNYNNLLKYCNLKKEVSKGLANKELVSLYEEQAIGAIRTTLSDYIIDKYFNEIK